jgi:hypothetical protein
MSGDCVLIPTENFNHIMTRTSYLSEVQESDIYSVAILGQSFPTPNQPLCELYHIMSSQVQLAPRW